MSTVKRPGTLAEVRDGLCQMYADVMSDPRRAPQVHEGTNALGKAVNSCKVYVQFCEMAKVKPSGEWARFISD